MIVTKPKYERINIAILVFVFGLIYGAHWKSYPTFVDERFTIFIANGIPLSSENIEERLDPESVAALTTKEIAENNTISNVWRNNIRDGGNGQLYYFIAHFWSIFLGRHIGVFISLKILSLLCSLCAVLILYRWIRYKSNSKTALLVSILFVATSAPFQIYIRNYAMSNLFVLLFFVIIDKFLNQQKDIRTIHKLSLYAVTASLPFLHFFNLILIALAGIFCFKQWIAKKLNTNCIAEIVKAIIFSVLLFSIYYFFLNKDGRNFQFAVTTHLRQIAQYYGTESNNWLAPSTPKYLVIENSEMALRLYGIDLRDSMRTIRMIFILPLLSIPIYLVYQFYRRNKSEVMSHNVLMISFSLFIVLGYTIFLNVLCLSSGHAVALNNQWYASPLMILTSASIGLIALKLNNRKTTILFHCLVIIAAINSFTFGFNPIIRDGSIPAHVECMKKIEQQFR